MEIIAFMFKGHLNGIFCVKLLGIDMQADAFVAVDFCCLQGLGIWVN